METSLGYPDFRETLDAALYEEAKSIYILPKKAKFLYGTSGFRNIAKYIRHVCFRSGVVAGLLAKFVAPLGYGIIITASHNPKEDNGIKIVHEKGFMLRISLEVPIQDFINAEDANQGFKILLEQVSADFKLSAPSYSVKGTVFIACDTRTSSPDLFNLAIKGIEAVGSVPLLCGTKTTPALHTMVANYTRKIESQAKTGTDPDSLYKDYIDGMCTHFSKIMRLIRSHEKANKYVPELILDCANGVGSITMDEIMPRIGEFLKIEMINLRDNTKLNEGCGGEYVQKEARHPSGAREACQKIRMDGSYFKAVALDGDADRTVYL